MVRWFGARHIAVGGGAAVAAPVIAGLLSQSSGAWRVALVVSSAGLALVGFLVPAAKSKINEEGRERAEERALAAGTTMRLTLSDTLLPALSQVVSDVDPSKGKNACEVVGATLQTVLLSATRLCGADHARTRACWYPAEVRDDGRKVLAPQRHVGRGAKPSTEFSSDEPRGLALFTLLEKEKTELWRDLAVERPPDWKPTGNDTTYSSAMVVPVSTNGQGYGLLMIDTDEPNVLTTADVFTMQTLAGLLSLAMSQAGGRAAAQNGATVGGRAG